MDRYDLLCVLAQGGMGTVWLARITGKLGFERLVALKTILPEYTDDRQFGGMFLDEAGIAARVDHENVARILEIGEDRGFLYYAMELIDGESLRKVYRDVRAQGATFPIGVALRICADLCAGLHAVHELRGPDGRLLEVVHRDVSPQNILVTVRGTTKLIDFGVAKARERRIEETAAGTLKGKLEYMAPEQAAGEPIDRRADVYAVGAILYELLAGRPVRETDDGRQLAALHDLVTGAPYAPLPPNVPHLVRAIVDRALMRDPNQRYGTADELRHALEQVILATGQSATLGEVARVLGHFSAERTTKRKAAIDAALAAAPQATTVAMAAPPVAAAAPGGPPRLDHDDDVIQERTVVAPLVQPPPGHMRPPPQGPYGPHGAMQMPFGAPMYGQPIVPNGPGDGPPTGPSMRTMEGASINALPGAYAGSPPRTSPSRVFAGALVIGLVVLLGVVAGLLVTKRGPDPIASTAAPTPVPVPVPVDSGVAATAPTEKAPPVVIAPPPVETASAEPAPEPEPTTKQARAPSTPASTGNKSSSSSPPVRRRGSSSHTSPRGGSNPSSSDSEYGF